MPSSADFAEAISENASLRADLARVERERDEARETTLDYGTKLTEMALQLAAARRELRHVLMCSSGSPGECEACDEIHAALSKLGRTP